MTTRAQAVTELGESAVRLAERTWRRRGRINDPTYPGGGIAQETADYEPTGPTLSAPTTIHATRHVHTYAADEPTWTMDRPNG